MHQVYHQQTDAEHEFNLLQMLIAEVKRNKVAQEQESNYVNHHKLHSYPKHA